MTISKKKIMIFSAVRTVVFAIKTLGCNKVFSTFENPLPL